MVSRYYNQDTYKCEKKEITQCENLLEYNYEKWMNWRKMIDIQAQSENSFDNMFICQRLCQGKDSNSLTMRKIIIPIPIAFNL